MNLSVSGFSGLRLACALIRRYALLSCLMVLFSGSVVAQNRVVESGGDQSVGNTGDQPLTVFVSILPEKFLVERISGRFASVNVMVGPGQSPETYEPSPRQLVGLSDARLYFSSGMSFEKIWMKRIRGANRQLRIVDLSDAGGVNPGGDFKDPHLWVSPIIAGRLSLQILNALQEIDPQNASSYAKNHRQLSADLKALHAEIQSILEPYSGKAFLVMHPAWGHFADAYRLQQVALEREGKEPAAKELGKLIQWAKKNAIKTVFIQSQHSKHLAEKVADEIGANVVRLDPLAEDYMANLRLTAMKIAESFAQ